MQLIALVVGHQLPECHALEQRRQLLEQLRVVAATLVERLRVADQRRGIASGQQLGEPHHVLALHGAEHRARIGLQRPAIAVGQQLIEQRQRIAQAAIARLRQQLYGGRLELDVLGLQDLRAAAR